MSALKREDFRIPADQGIEIFVREVRPAAGELASGAGVLLLHGARVPGLASFDLPVHGGSLAADLAAAGHVVYIMDARGYGGSTRPPEMNEPPAGHPPLVRSVEVVRDAVAVMEWICQRSGRGRLALLGWATGGHWLGYAATLAPHRVSHLVLHNTLYGGTAEHPSLGRGSDLEAPNHPGQFNAAAYGAYRYNAGESLLTGWDRSIPLADPDDWRDPLVGTAFVNAALASDPASSLHSPPSFRAPTGALEDSFYLACGRQLWDASFIYAPTLIVRSALDFWSRPADVERLRADLVHAPAVRVVTLPEATHFVHLDRAERGRDDFLAEVLGFLSAV